MRETKACIQGSLVLRRSRATPSLNNAQGEIMNSREAEQAREVAPVLAPEQEWSEKISCAQILEDH